MKLEKVEWGRFWCLGFGYITTRDTINKNYMTETQLLMIGIFCFYIRKHYIIYE